MWTWWTGWTKTRRRMEDGSVSEVCAVHAGLEKWLERMESKLGRIEEAIVGNGKPGLNQRVRDVEAAIARAEKEEAAAAARAENRVLTAVRVVGPWALGVVAVWLGLR